MTETIPVTPQVQTTSVVNKAPQKGVSKTVLIVAVLITFLCTAVACSVAGFMGASSFLLPYTSDLDVTPEVSETLVPVVTEEPQETGARTYKHPIYEMALMEGWVYEESDQNGRSVSTTEEASSTSFMKGGYNFSITSVFIPGPEPCAYDDSNEETWPAWVPFNPISDYTEITSRDFVFRRPNEGGLVCAADISETSDNKYIEVVTLDTEGNSTLQLSVTYDTKSALLEQEIDYMLSTFTKVD